MAMEPTVNCLYCFNNILEGHGLCSMHYQRWRHKRPMEGPHFYAAGWLQQGYRKICTPDGREMHEHRYKKECEIKRQLYSNEVVHHKNGIKTDNRLENLEIMDVGLHTSLHCKKSTIQRICKACGKPFELISKLNKRQQETCSHRCGTSLFWRRKKGGQNEL